MDLELVKLTMVPGEHEIHLQDQLKLLYSRQYFCDTRLVCVDGEMRVNSMIAALAFPELYSSTVFSSHLSDGTILLPEYRVADTRLILAKVLTFSAELSVKRNHVKTEGSETDYFAGELDYVSEHSDSEEQSLDLLEVQINESSQQRKQEPDGNQEQEGVETDTTCDKDETDFRTQEEENQWIQEYCSLKDQRCQCKLCGKNVRIGKSNFNGMENHLLKNHSVIFKSVCLFCKSGLDEVDLLGRDEELEAERIECDRCGCIFHRSCVNIKDEDWCLYCRSNKGSRGLKRPEKTEKDGDSKKTSLCPECGKEFRHLSQHIKFFHLGLIKHKPAECHICRKVYSQKSHLNEHIRAVHEQIKEHKCKFCGREFYRKIHFRRHMRTMHMNIHENDCVSCTECGKDFNSKNALYKHNRVVHLGIRPAKNQFCEDCGQSFTQSGSLYSHMRKVHHKEPDIPKNRTNIYKDKVFVETNLILEVHPELKAELTHTSLQ